MQGQNIGDLLNKRGVTWGWFQGGFEPTGTANGYAVCGATHTNVGGIPVVDYSPHHNPFEYYAVDGEPAPPAAVVGRRDRPHRPGQPRVRPDRLRRRGRGEQPAVGQLPEGAGVPGRSRRLLGPARRADVPRQHDQLAGEVARTGRRPRSSIAYDDSDGWYDHVSPTIVQRLDGRGERPGRPLRRREGRRRVPGPLRRRPASAAARDQPVQQDELRRPHEDRPDRRC